MPSLYELAVTAGARGLPAAAECEALLAGYLAEGRARAPGAVLDDAAFVAHVVARLDDGGLAQLHGGDLFLAAALERQDAAALAVFERDIVPDVRASLARMQVDASEALQALRVHLFIGARPRIADYRGHGALRAWVRVSATRMAWRAAGRHAKERALDAAVLEAWPEGSPAPGAAATRLREDLRGHLERAVSAGLATLSPRARTLLRQQVLDGLTIDELAGLYRVHRATCARWLARRVRQALGEALRLPAADMASVLRAVDSQLHLSLSRLLRASEPPA